MRSSVMPCLGQSRADPTQLKQLCPTRGLTNRANSLCNSTIDSFTIHGCKSLLQGNAVGLCTNKFLVINVHNAFTYNPRNTQISDK